MDNSKNNDFIYIRDDGIVWRGEECIRSLGICVDKEIASYIEELNKREYTTVYSCAGHVKIYFRKRNYVEPYIRFYLTQEQIDKILSRALQHNFVIRRDPQIIELVYCLERNPLCYERVLFGEEKYEKDFRSYRIVLKKLVNFTRSHIPANFCVRIYPKKDIVRVRELDYIRKSALDYLLEKIFI